jgi:hypothetical protein
MTPIVLWVVLACGVDAGYEPAPDGHLEYIVQIEPQLLESLAAGHNVTSEVPKGLDIRHYRLTVGSAALPHLAAPAGGGQPSAAGGAPARAADAFETPGRADEAVGMGTPQVRVGYQLLSASSGQYECVIELDPRALGDLNQADLTDDIPPGLPVSRFVISTNPGSAAVEKPNRAGGVPYTPTIATPPAVVGAGPGAGDDDPSNWQPEVPMATPDSPQTSSAPPTSSTGSAVPDDAPGGAFPPPAAMPPHEEPAQVPPSGPANTRPEFVDPPGGSFRPKGSGSDGAHAGDARAHDDRPPAVEMPLPSGAAPGRFPATGEPFVAMTSGVDEPSEAHASGEHKPRDTAAGAGDQNPDRGAADGKGDKEKKEFPPTKPWLPLTLAMLALFASLGGNVFLGWIAWDSYNRDRAAADKFADSEASSSS